MNEHLKNVNSGRVVKRKPSRLKIWVVLGIMVLVAAGAAGTFIYKFNTSDATIAEGNRAFAAEQYDAALEKYGDAQASAPMFAEPFYNAANVLYKQGKFQEAQGLLDEALKRSNDKLAEFIAFNLGNVAFNGNEFEQAIARYEDALRLNPEDVDAKYNLELALLQKEQQDQQQKQDKQQQDQQKQDQEQQSEQGQDQKREGQDQKDKQGQQGQEQDRQGQDGQENGQDKTGQGQQDEKQDGQQGEGGQEGQDAQNGQKQDAQSQQQGAQSQQQNQPQEQAGQQPQAQAGQQGTGSAGEPTDEQGQEQGMGYVPGELTQEQAEQLLAAVGSNSETLMQALQQYLYVPGDEPEKDW